MNMVKAVEAVREGLSPYHAASKFGVPESTVRLKTKGIVKTDSLQTDQSSEPAKRWSYSKETMYNALLAAKKGMSVCSAARQFGVPESSLSSRLKRPHPLKGTRSSPLKLFTPDQEQTLIDHIKHMARIGYRFARCNIRLLAGDYANACGKKLKAQKPLSSNWYDLGFIKRWPDLQLILKPSKASEARRAAQDASDNYFKELADILITNDLLESPGCIYMYIIDDFSTKPEADEAQAISIIAGGNATGYYIPPLCFRARNEILCSSRALPPNRPA